MAISRSLKCLKSPLVKELSEKHNLSMDLGFFDGPFCFVFAKPIFGIKRIKIKEIKTDGKKEF